MKRSRSSQRGLAYVEVLVIVAVVLTLGALAVGTLARSSNAQAAKEAECIRTFACAPGSASGAGGGGSVSGVGVASRSNGTATPTLGDYIGDVIRGAALGDYAEGGSAGARMLGQILVGFTPLGIAGDIRDLSAALKELREGREGAGKGVLLAGVGFLPGGDLLKLGKLGGKRGVATAAKQLGDLRPEEVSKIQRAADELGSDIYVTGSAARGERRAIGSDLPLAGFGKSKTGTRSDIDYAVKRTADDAADKLDLPDKDASFGVRGVDYINLDKGPVIRFRPGQPPEVITGNGKLPL